MNFSLGFYIKALSGVAVAILGLMLALGGFYTVDGGKTAIIQNTLTGSIDVARGPKFGLKMPIFSSVEIFTDVSTVSFGSATDENTRNLEPIRVSFADTYKSDIQLSFRFRLPSDDKQMIAVFTDYRRYDNMIDNLFVKNAVNVTTVTGTQFTGEEFFQGGVSAATTSYSSSNSTHTA